jgi:NAD-dependent dihydropyrimidine dehydrogenase PreA subunit
MKAISMIEDTSAVIDETKCIGCGKCYDACQPEVIERYEVEE